MRLIKNKSLIIYIVMVAIFELSFIDTSSAESTIMTKDQIVESLSAPEKSNATRGIRVDPKNGLGRSDEKAPNQALSKSVSDESLGLVILDIKFEFNSSELSTSAIAQIQELGKALASTELADGEFEISGHTDSIGNDSYNKSLSFKRAQSVEQYLLNNFNINSSSIISRGYGEEKLLFATDSTNSANRRVEIRRTE